MYRSNDEYLKATQHAQINTYDKSRGVTIKLVLLNLTMLLFVGFFIFNYFYKDEVLSLFSKKEGVLGVSYHATDKNEYSDNELMVILDNAEVDKVAESSNSEIENLSNEISKIIDGSSMKESSSYSESISKELDDKKGVRGRVVLVKKGDTLSTLAEKYYGDSKAFQKIIDANKNLSKQSRTLYVGDEITIPYY